MRIAIAAVMAALVAGCAAPTETFWVKPGASDQDFYMDRGQCQAQSFGIPGVSMLQAAMVFNSCMAGKGWWQESRRRA